MRQVKWWTFLIGLIFVVPGLVFAQGTEGETESDAVALGQVVVTATRTERTFGITGSVTVIDREDIEKSTAQSADELLKEVVGVTLKHDQGPISSGTSNRVTMRGLDGTSEARVLILRDGVPINDPYSGSVEWNEFAIGDIERIEIVRGAGSALYGSNAMGGVINIITKKPEKEMKTFVEGAYGSLNTWSLSLGNSGTIGKLGYYISGKHLDSDGYCTTPEAVRKDFETDKSTERENVTGRLTYEIAPGSSVTLSGTHHNSNDTGKYSTIPDYDVFFERQNRVSLNYQQQRDLWDLSATVYGSDEKSGYDSPNSYSNPTALGKTSTNDQDIFGGTIQASMDVGQMNILTFGSDYKRARIDRHDDYQTSSRDVLVKGKQEYAALFVQDEIKLRGNLLAVLGLRYDWWKSYDGYSYDDNLTPTETWYAEKTDDSWNPKIRVNYRPVDGTLLRASVGKAFRAPTLYDLYRTWKGYYTYQSNPDLNPETVISYEGGIDQELGDKVTFRATYYESEAKDFIYSVTIDTVNKIKKKKNVGKVRIRGVELEADCRLSQEWSLFANYTFNESKIREFKDDPSLEGKYLTNSPKQKYAFGITYSNPDVITAKIVGRYVGPRFYDDANETELEGYFTTDVKLSRRIGEHFEVALDAINIADVNYKWTSSSESPGRIIMGTVKATF